MIGREKTIVDIAVMRIYEEIILLFRDLHYSLFAVHFLDLFDLHDLNNSEIIKSTRNAFFKEYSFSFTAVA